MMCGEAYLQSARIAEQCPDWLRPRRKFSADITGGACPGWYMNQEPFLNVIRMHRDFSQ